MESIKFRTHISTARAIALGLCQSGAGHVSPTETDLAVLSAEEREAATAYADGGNRALAVEALGWEGFVAALRDEIVAETERKERAAADSADRVKAAVAYARGLGAAGLIDIRERPNRLRWVHGMPAALTEADAVAVAVQISDLLADATALAVERDAVYAAGQAAAAAAAAAERVERVALELAAAAKLTDATAAWIAVHGTESQRARFAEGLLPEQEMWGAIRDEVFSSITSPRYERMVGGDIEHDNDCPDPRAAYGVNPLAALDADQYARLVQIRRVAPAGATVAPRLHYASCGDCSVARVERASVLVTLDWFGRELSREYAL